MSMNFTAVINCFNEEDFIKYAIESIIPYVQEIIVVDNCSTDKTINIINEIIAKNSMGEKIKLFALDKPKQLADARNFALSKSNNEWIIKWDGDFCAFSEHDAVNDQCAPFPELIDYIQENCDKYDIFLLYSLNLCGDIYHYDKTRKFLGLSGDSFVGKKSCMSYQVNDKYGDVGHLRTPEGNIPRFCYLNKPEKNKMYFLHIYGVKNDEYLLYRRFLSEYQVWIANHVYLEFWEWMRNIKEYDTESGMRHVKKQLLDNLEKHSLPLPEILSPIVDNPKYIVEYTNGQISERREIKSW